MAGQPMPGQLAVPCRPGPFGTAEAQPSKRSPSWGDVRPALDALYVFLFPKSQAVALTPTTSMPFYLNNGGRVSCHTNFDALETALEAAVTELTRPNPFPCLTNKTAAGGSSIVEKAKNLPTYS